TVRGTPDGLAGATSFLLITNQPGSGYASTVAAEPIGRPPYAGLFVGQPQYLSGSNQGALYLHAGSSAGPLAGDIVDCTGASGSQLGGAVLVAAVGNGGNFLVASRIGGAG